MARDRELIERFLDYLIDPNNCIDTYGRTYLDDLEIIVAENHGFDPVKQSFPDVATQDWFERIRKDWGFARFEDIAAYVREHRGEFDIANARPRSAFQGEALFENEESFRDLKQSVGSIEKSNAFQRSWSMLASKELPFNDKDADSYETYMSADRVNPWTYLIRREIRCGKLGRNDRVICIGNRWLGEIRYFRENIGLAKAVGVDLFSGDPELVVAADMHDMPFEDGSIRMIFNRGLINKSYDVRLLIKEMLRVLTDDGYLIVETPGPYDWGVSQLGRTDIKGVQNLLRLLRGKVRRVIFAEETKPKRYLYDSTRLIRVFIQIDKRGHAGEPEWETFPQRRFNIYDRYRHYLLRIRGALRALGVLRKPASAA
jgi:SAM-dependent methyltransferase